MPIQEKYTQRLGLGNLDVFLDTPINDTSYFTIGNLAQTIGYGKHGFTIAYNDPTNSDLLLKNGTGILFEFVDANGETVFSELSDIPDVSGAATGYIWIKKDPLWIAQEIADGPLTLYVVGELDGVPEEFEDTYNLRSTFTYNIRKSFPNTSKIIFYDVPSLEASASFTETQEEDLKPGYSRGYINVSSSFMQTHGGKVSFIELSYQETGSQSDTFNLLNTYPVEGPTSRFEIEDTGSIDGLNPISHTFKMPIPRSIRRDTPVIFKLRYLDADKAPAKYYNENKLNQDIVITSSVIEINGSPMIIEQEDNLLAGSMYTGQAVGKGFEQSGKSSAYLKTVDYQGFASASQGLAPGGVMFFSGSVLTSSGDDYDGVGLELFADTESFLRFRSNPSELDIRAKAFFVGSRSTQFISASGGVIEISSSNFHLQPDGDVSMAGTIEAADGKIGGFHISESRINSANEKIILKASGQISASSLLLASGSFVIDADNLSRFGSDDFQSFVMVENTGVIMQTSNFNLNTARFIISSSDVGVMAVGSTPPTEFNSGKGFYVDGDGNLLIGDSQGPRIQFDGFDTIISSSNFFLGSGQQFVSGSLGNIEISSSNFHLDANGNVSMAGTITATAGEIGGFSVSADALSSTNFFISGAATGAELFISSSGFSVDAQGVVSASDLSLQGGDVGGLTIAEGTVSVGEILKLKDSGQITGSQVLFTGGKIASFNLSDDAFSTDSFFISSSATDNDMFISSSNFNVKASGDITGSNVLFTGGKISGSNLTMEVPTFFLGSPSQFVSGSSGNIEITSSNFHLDTDGTVRMSGTITATAGKIAGWTISGDTLVGNNATLDGAGAALFRSDAGPDTDNSAAFDILRDEYYIDFSPADQGNTKNYYVKFGPNFAVDTDGVLFASGAQFEGTVSASKGIIGGFTTDGSSFSDNNGQIFISGSPAVGGIDHPKYMFISSSNFNVKQNGDVTGSQALFTGGKVGGWVMTDSTLTGGVVTLNSAGSIEVGGLSDATTTATTNSGFFADSSGNVLIKGNVSDNDYLKISAGGGIDIRSQVFDLDAGTLVIDSATRNGTIALGATPNVNIDGTNAGVYMNGLGDFLVRVDANNFIKVDQDATVKLDMKAESFFLGGTSQFVTGSNGNIAISSSNFHLDTAGNVNMSGTVTATAGKIAGFTISGNSLTATNFEIDASGKRITLGDAASTDLFVADADEGIQLGNNTFGLAPFSVTKAGVLKAVAGTIGGYGISATAISSSNDNLILKNSGQITGSTVLFTGGKVGGFGITSTHITSSNLLFDSANSKLVVGSANKITIQGGGTDNFITMGSKTAFAQSSTAGIILGMDNNVPSFDLTRNATNYVRFDTSTGVDIKTDTFKLDTATLDIDSSTSRIQVVNGSSNEVIRFGEISDSASDLYGLKVYDGSGTADSNTLVKLGGEGNTIGGWTITNDQIQSDNLIIHSSGRLETADFASGVKGWRISSIGNGEAEFENATIRGTLSTAVFEKETVNAVGGQLYVANSTALTGSGQISASFDTMSVVNVSGFVAGEILSLKKVTETGFTTEYVLVNSASRDDDSSDTNFAGKLMVTRGYGSGSLGDSGSLGGTPANSQSYEPGQVIVSTGKVGTGYIRLNANPNDQATPYMDIVERTGVGIYDVELKTRVGDLSGLSSATLFGNANPGFGIFTENGFFKGGINATTGSFTGVVHINTSASEIMKLGTNVDSTNDGIHINNNNYWYTDSQFKVGDANSFILHDGAGDIKIVSENFTLKGGSKLLMTTQSLAFDTSNASTATRTAGTGIFMSSSGDFRVGNASGNRLTFSGTSLELVTSDLNIDTSTFDLSTDGTGKIALGATPPTDISSGTGFFVDGAGNFLAGNASGNFIRFNQSSGAVQVAGEITIAAGSTSEVDFGAGAAASASVASASAAAAEVSASVAQISASVAQAIANDAVASASEASSSAVTATAAASTAQAAIDTMETQVVLNSGGMDLRNNSNLNLVSYGVNTKFFDGVGDDDGNMKLRLNTDGVFAFANHTGSFARFYNEGIQIVSGGVERAKFAETTTIGNPSFEHVEITSASLKLKGGANGNTVRLSMDADGMQIGSVSNGITLNASGDATFNGAITISPSDLPDGTVSGSAQLADAISGSSAPASASAAAMATQVVLDSNGMSLKSQDTSKTLASFGTTVTIGENADDKSRVFIDDNSVDLIVDSGGTDTTFASFGATTTVGNTSAEHVSIDSDSVDIIQDSNNKAVLDASGLTISQSGAGVAKFAGTTTIGNTGAEHLLLNTSGLAIKDGTSTRASLLNTGVTLNGASTNDQMIVNSSGVQLKQGGTVRTTLASNKVTIGKSDDNRIEITDTAFSLFEGSTEKIAINSSDVRVKFDDNNYAMMDANSFDVVLNGKTSASFGTTTTIGSTDSAHTFIDSGSFKLKDGSNERLIMDANGIRMGNQFSVAADGTATFGGTLTIGNLVSSSAQLADAISGSSNAVSASLAEQTAQQLVDSASVASAVQITSDGLNILRADNGSELASYGATTTIGSTSGEHISISSDAFEIKTDANTTVLSASSAGLEMQGTVRATAGEIGGFEIEPKALKKSVFTDGQLTASVTLSPDTGSHNSLLFRMNAIRNNGNATLYELVNTKPANDSTMIENFGRVQGNFRELGDFHDRSETRDLSGDVITTSIASGSFMQRIYFPQGSDSALPGKVEQRMVSQESGSRSRIIQSVESLGLGQTHARLFFDGHTGAVSASNQIFTSTGNLAQTTATPQRNGKGIVIDSFGAIGAPGEAIPGVFMGSTGSYFRYMGRDGADVLQISSSNFILDAGSLLTPKLEIEGKVTATSGDIAGYEILPEGFRKTETLTGSVKKNITLSPSTGSKDLAMIKLSSIKAPKLNLFEVVQGRFTTTPQQTIFGAFNGNGLNAGAHNDAVWDDIGYLDSTIPEQRDFSNVTGSYIKIINDADNTATTFGVIAQNIGLSPSVNLDAGASTIGGNDGVASAMYIGGYEGAISSSFQGLSSAYGSGKGVVADALVFNGETVSGFFAGLGRADGNNMESYIAYSGRSSENGIVIKLGNHLQIQHAPGTSATDAAGHFSFNLSGSANTTNIRNVNTGSFKHVTVHNLKVEDRTPAHDFAGYGPGAQGWHYTQWSHNHSITVSTSQIFLPWNDNTEQTAMIVNGRPTSAYLSPFAMELQRICWRFSGVTDGTPNITWRLHTIANGSSTVVEAAQADFTSTMSANTYYEVVRSDFTQYDMDEETPPDVSANSLVGLSYQSSGAIHSLTSQNIYVTSVWKVNYIGNIRGQGN